MPRKCCTLWDGKACRSNYDTTKTMPQMKVTTFSFPEDPNERESWIKSLPNILTCQVSKNIGICEKHFPPDCPRVKKRGGSCVPVVPPSIFGTTKSSLFVQTNFSPRAVITAESRRLNEEARKLEADRIASFDQIFNYCTKFSPEHILIQESNAVKIVKLNGWPPEVDYSILVTNDRRVIAYKKNFKISTRDLVNGFTNAVDKFSQIDAIINRLKETPINIKTELSNLGAKVLDLKNEIDSEDERRQVFFIGKQLMLFNRHRFTSDDMAEAINLYLRSRNSFRALRELLILPSHNTICDYFGKIGIAGSDKECERTLKKVFSNLNDGQKHCFISFDEIHIKPGFQYQGKYVFGNAQNTDVPVPAKTILAVMINPSFGAPAFVARLVPVSCLKADYLFTILNPIIELIHKCGGQVFGIMSDNLSVNQKTFKLFHNTYNSQDIYSVTHPINNSLFEKLFTLYDPTHLFKNIRNNWVTEKTQTLEFVDFESGKTCNAKWKDLIFLYKSELESDLKLTKLDYKTLHPNNFEKQKVHLVCNVFNEKTCAALIGKEGKEDTLKFVQYVTKMWNILNIRSPDTSYRLNDPNRKKFTDPSDPRLDFLLKMSKMFKEMDSSLRGQRIRGLTGDTSNALHVTLLGLVDLIKVLLDKHKYSYVLPGKFSSDRIEGEFGICRQSSGGNYLISAEQVINSLRLQRIKLYNKLDIDGEKNLIENDCCEDPIVSEEDFLLIEKSFEGASDLNEIEKTTLYYICGYVTFKEKIVCEDENESTSFPPESEFTINLSRGKLKLPPIVLYDFSQYCYSFFKSRNPKCCTKIFLTAFNEIYVYSGYHFPEVSRIIRRLCNCFFKAFVKRATDDAKTQKDQRETKKRRLSSR